MHSLESFISGLTALEALSTPIASALSSSSVFTISEDSSISGASPSSTMTALVVFSISIHKSTLLPASLISACSSASLPAGSSYSFVSPSSSGRPLFSLLSSVVCSSLELSSSITMHSVDSCVSGLTALEAFSSPVSSEATSFSAFTIAEGSTNSPASMTELVKFSTSIHESALLPASLISACSSAPLSAGSSYSFVSPSSSGRPLFSLLSSLVCSSLELSSSITMHSVDSCVSGLTALEAFSSPVSSEATSFSAFTIAEGSTNSPASMTELIKFSTSIHESALLPASLISACSAASLSAGSSYSFVSPSSSGRPLFSLLSSVVCSSLELSSSITMHSVDSCVSGLTALEAFSSPVSSEATSFSAFTTAEGSTNSPASMTELIKFSTSIHESALLPASLISACSSASLSAGSSYSFVSPSSSGRPLFSLLSSVVCSSLELSSSVTMHSVESCVSGLTVLEAFSSPVSSEATSFSAFTIAEGSTNSPASMTELVKFSTSIHESASLPASLISACSVASLSAGSSYSFVSPSSSGRPLFSLLSSVVCSLLELSSSVTMHSVEPCVSGLTALEAFSSPVSSEVTSFSAFPIAEGSTNSPSSMTELVKFSTSIHESALLPASLISACSMASLSAGSSYSFVSPSSSGRPLFSLLSSVVCSSLELSSFIAMHSVESCVSGLTALEAFSAPISSEVTSFSPLTIAEGSTNSPSSMTELVKFSISVHKSTSLPASVLVSSPSLSLFSFCSSSIIISFALGVSATVSAISCIPSSVCSLSIFSSDNTFVALFSTVSFSEPCCSAS
ncbi:hypothetical protein XELAEV_18025082mg [Xenopus laevis]|uniref:Uncharacterized protein n=1 Tax=Xenopus laevis TaxID=8355 RepID=A0A974HLS8_XENLA|nr:hypothetical protein XELAEV_18025082mg [Xenopus laevis]